MTIIAWDGKTLAADKMACLVDHGAKTTKIFPVAESSYAAIAGDHAKCLELVQWIKDGAERERFPKQDREDSVKVIVATKGEKTIKLYENTPDPIVFEDDYLAWGSGRDYALAALFLGKTSAIAVSVANSLCTSCGLGIDSVKINK